MVAFKAVFSGFSVNDIEAAKQFYGETLGLKLVDDSMGLRWQLPSGGELFMYGKPDHQPAAYTALNFVVDDIDTAVDELAAKGVMFEHYNDMPVKPDEKGILRGRQAQQGPDIAWFKDPAGNILAVLQP